MTKRTSPFLRPNAYKDPARSPEEDKQLQGSLREWYGRESKSDYQYSRRQDCPFQIQFEILIKKLIEKAKELKLENSKRMEMLFNKAQHSYHAYGDHFSFKGNETGQQQEEALFFQKLKLQLEIILFKISKSQDKDKIKITLQIFIDQFIMCTEGVSGAVHDAFSNWNQGETFSGMASTVRGEVLNTELAKAKNKANVISSIDVHFNTHLSAQLSKSGYEVPHKDSEDFYAGHLLRYGKHLSAAHDGVLVAYNTKKISEKLEEKSKIIFEKLTGLWNSQQSHEKMTDLGALGPYYIEGFKDLIDLKIITEDKLISCGARYKIIEGFEKKLENALIESKLDQSVKENIVNIFNLNKDKTGCEDGNCEKPKFHQDVLSALQPLIEEKLIDEGDIFFEDFVYEPIVNPECGENLISYFHQYLQKKLMGEEIKLSEQEGERLFSLLKDCFSEDPPSKEKFQEYIQSLLKKSNIFIEDVDQYIFEINDEEKENLLIEAAMRGEDDFIKKLLLSGANPQPMDFKKTTATQCIIYNKYGLYTAAQQNELIKLFLQNKEFIKSEIKLSDSQLTAIIGFIKESNRQNCVKSFFELIKCFWMTDNILYILSLIRALSPSSFIQISEELRKNNTHKYHAVLSVIFEGNGSPTAGLQSAWVEYLLANNHLIDQEKGLLASAHEKCSFDAFGLLLVKLQVSCKDKFIVSDKVKEKLEKNNQRDKIDCIELPDQFYQSIKNNELKELKEIFRTRHIVSPQEESEEKAGDFLIRQLASIFINSFEEFRKYYYLSSKAMAHLVKEDKNDLIVREFSELKSSLPLLDIFLDFPAIKVNTVFESASESNRYLLKLFINLSNKELALDLVVENLVDFLKNYENNNEIFTKIIKLVIQKIGYNEDLYNKLDLMLSAQYKQMLPILYPNKQKRYESVLSYCIEKFEYFREISRTSNVKIEDFFDEIRTNLKTLFNKYSKESVELSNKMNLLVYFYSLEKSHDSLTVYLFQNLKETILKTDCSDLNVCDNFKRGIFKLLNRAVQARGSVTSKDYADEIKIYEISQNYCSIISLEKDFRKIDNHYNDFLVTIKNNQISVGDHPKLIATLESSVENRKISILAVDFLDEVASLLNKKKISDPKTIGSEFEKLYKLLGFKQDLYGHYREVFQSRLEIILKVKSGHSATESLDVSKIGIIKYDLLFRHVIMTPKDIQSYRKKAENEMRGINDQKLKKELLDKFDIRLDLHKKISALVQYYKPLQHYQSAHYRECLLVHFNEASNSIIDNCLGKISPAEKECIIQHYAREISSNIKPQPQVGGSWKMEMAGIHAIYANFCYKLDSLKTFKKIQQLKEDTKWAMHNHKLKAISVSGDPKILSDNSVHEFIKIGGKLDVAIKKRQQQLNASANKIGFFQSIRLIKTPILSFPLFPTLGV